MVEGIREFEPRSKATPQGLDLGPAVYSSPLPAFAAAHGFRWSSNEGFTLYVVDCEVVFKVPERFRYRLLVPVYLYELPPDHFEITPEETTGWTFHSRMKVVPLDVRKFGSVEEAIFSFGGHVKYVRFGP